MANDRLTHLIRFYAILDRLETAIGGARLLAQCSGRMDWPRRGIYFFREQSEARSDSGTGLRIVRVGTHALKEGSATALWTRLSQHRGQAGSGGGNHRGSIFRDVVGAALIRHDALDYPTWGEGSSAPKAIRDGEIELERRVSAEIGAMPFLWLDIGDDPGPGSIRGHMERQSIALLSNFRKRSLDSPSANWLGRSSDRERVRAAGLWNNNHIDEGYDPTFLDALGDLVERMKKVR